MSTIIEPTVTVEEEAEEEGEEGVEEGAEGEEGVPRIAWAAGAQPAAGAAGAGAGAGDGAGRSLQMFGFTVVFEENFFEDLLNYVAAGAVFSLAAAYSMGYYS